MTIEALQLLMATRQRELRRLVVIEICVPPVIRVMAGFALRAVPALVRIVSLMAGIACRIEILVINIAGMAPCALNLAVLANQRK